MKNPYFPDLKGMQQAKEDYDKKMSLVAHAPRFGYALLDEMIPGLLPGQMTVFAGGTSMGKTTFLANCAYNMAYLQDKGVFFASLESGESIIQPILNISGGELSDNIHVFAPKTMVTLEGLQQVVKENIEICDVLIIDHIHYLATSRSSNYSAQIGDLTRQIQLFASNMNIPVVLVSHVRKMASETQIPSLHDLKDSSALYQDPSTVIIIHRFKHESDELVSDITLSKYSNQGALLVEKNRDFGSTGNLPLEFNPQTLKFAVGGEWIKNTTN